MKNSPTDAQTFREQGHALVDRLADHLERAAAGDGKAVSWRPPEAAALDWRPDFDAAGGDHLLDVLERVMDSSIHNHHPGTMGYQVSVPLPAAALADLASGVLANGMAAYDSGPASSAIEQAVVRWMTDTLGMGPDADGVLTSGGSLGNLTALLAARQARAGFDVWKRGASERPLCLLAGEHAHYSVTRTAGILGIGEEGVALVPVDERFRLDVRALADVHARVRREGRQVIALIANAGSTATGAFDPLPAIADFCCDEGVWLHVDAAHGASAILSPTDRGRLRGIERADSVVWDAHKLMGVPALATGVLFRDGARSYETFSQAASYLFEDGQPPPERPWYHRGTRTVECTKRMMSVPLYAVLRTVGPARIGASIELLFERARALATRIAREPGFEIANPEPDCNILCFRYRPDHPDVNALQDRIRSELLAEGRWLLSRTRIRDAVYLRAVVMNPRTTETHFDAMLTAVRRVGDG